MICPACGNRDTSVIESRVWHQGRVVVRRRSCECGVRWTTDEKLRRGSMSTLPVVAKHPTNGVPDTPQVASQPPSNSVGGVGGGLSSDPAPIRSVPESHPDSSKLRSPGRSKLMSPPAYAPEFERFWAESDKEGSKSDASKAWEQVGSPPADVLGASRLAWIQHWQGIGVKHIATWLRAYDWQQQPAARALPRVRNFRDEANDQAVQGYLALMAGRKGQ